NQVDRLGLMSPADCAALRDIITRLQTQLELVTDVSNTVLETHWENLDELFMFDRYVDAGATFGGGLLGAAINSIRAVNAARLAIGASLGVDLARTGMLTGPAASRFIDYMTPGLGGAIAGPILAKVLGDVASHGAGWLSEHTSSGILRQTETIIHSISYDLQVLTEELRDYRRV